MVDRKNFAYSKLRGRIVEMFYSYAEFARVLGVEREVVSRKLRNRVAFTKADIILWSELLEIPMEEIGIYFFEN